MENAKKANEAGKETVKDVYSFTYGEIKEQVESAKKGGDDEGGFCKGGKCNIF